MFGRSRRSDDGEGGEEGGGDERDRSEHFEVLVEVD